MATEMKSAKNNKKTKRLVWKSFTKKEYLQAATEMVHFSAKTVNSNALPFGIRLSINVKINLPYVAASLVNRNDIPMDYTRNIGKPSTMVKQINAVRHNTLNEFEQVPQADIDDISECYAILDSGYEPEDSVSIRLRQIILQNAAGNDVSASPLPCAGLSVLINKRIKEELDYENPLNADGIRKNEKHFFRRKRAYLGTGGANPQNVGLNIRAMQKPLMFGVPMMNERSRELKKAWAIYHKGITIQLNTALLTEFVLWQKGLLSSHFDIQPSDMDIQKRITEFLVAITHDFMARAATIEKLLRDNIEKLPDKKMCLSTLPFIKQALLDSSLRTMEWRREFADYLHTEIISQYVWVNKKRIALEAGKHETANWMGIIEGAL